MIVTHDTVMTILEAMTLEVVVDSAVSARTRSRCRRSAQVIGPAGARPPGRLVAGSVCTTAVWVGGGPEGRDIPSR
jgi:hypothetical protein